MARKSVQSKRSASGDGPSPSPPLLSITSRELQRHVEPYWIVSADAMARVILRRALALDLKAFAAFLECNHEFGPLSVLAGTRASLKAMLDRDECGGR